MGNLKIVIFLLMPFVALSQNYPRFELYQLKQGTDSGQFVLTGVDSNLAFNNVLKFRALDSTLLIGVDTVAVKSDIASSLLGNIDAGLGIEVNEVDGQIVIESLSIEDSIKNQTGTLISKGTPLYATGVQGNYWTVAPADASDPSKMPVVVIAGEDIADGGTGLGLIKGHIKQVSTVGLADGAEVYVGSGGGYTSTKPTAEGVIIQRLGTVIKGNSANGSGIINLGDEAYWNDYVDRTELGDSLALFLKTEVDGSVTNELQTISTSGAAGNITLSNSGGTLNLNVNDADASVSNEGSLSVGAGGTNTSTINSNTSGSSAITISGSSSVTVTENTSTNTITLASSGAGGGFWTEGATSGEIYYNGGFVGINDTDPSYTLDVTGDINFTSGLYQNGNLLTIGDITSVVAGSGLYGVNEQGPGVVYINVGSLPNSGIDVTTNEISVDVSDFMSNGTNLGILKATGSDAMEAISQLQYSSGNLQHVSTSSTAFLRSFNSTSGTGSLDGVITGLSLTDGYLVNYESGELRMGTNNHEMTLQSNGSLLIDYYGGSSTQDIGVNNNGEFIYYSSDGRFKTVVNKNIEGIDAIMKLKPIEYKWDDGMMINDGYNEIGFIAQEVKKAIPLAVPYEEKDVKIMSYKHRAITATLVKAMQEQQLTIELQDKRIQQLEEMVKQLINNKQ